MCKKVNYLIVFAALLFMSGQLSGQDKFGVRFMTGEKEDGGIAYNFFIGDDAEAFATSINGFGSGFMFDVLTGRQSYELISIGTKGAYLSLGAGFAISKYRFQDNLILEKVDGKVTFMEDPDETNDYVNTFFGYGKSKLVTASIYFPAYLNFNLGKNFKLSSGAFIDLYVYGKHKRKFKIGDEKHKKLIKPDEFKDFNLNKTKYGLSATLMHKPSGVGLSGTYFLTPFFEEGKGPDLTEVRISLVFNPQNVFAGMNK